MGLPGYYGAPGRVGRNGPKGDQGSPGKTGRQGPAGAEGKKGDKGESGAQGPTSLKGQRGKKGQSGCDDCCSRWYFTFSDAECSSPCPIDGAFYMLTGTNHNLHPNRHIEGHCNNIHVQGKGLSRILGRKMYCVPFQKVHSTAGNFLVRFGVIIRQNYDRI